MGQFTQAEPVHAWNKLCPLLRGNAFFSPDKISDLVVKKNSHFLGQNDSSKFRKTGKFIPFIFGEAQMPLKMERKVN